MSKPIVDFLFVFPSTDDEMHRREQMTPEEYGRLSTLKRDAEKTQCIAYRLLRDFEYEGTGAGAYGPAEFPQIVRDFLMILASSGVTTAAHQILRNWVDNRNGRKIKIKIGDLEVEATQMSPEKFLKFFATVRELERDDQVRDALTNAGFKVNRRQS